MCSFIHRLAEETCESEKVGKQSWAMWWKSLPGGENTGGVPLSWPCFGLIQGTAERPGWMGEPGRGQAGSLGQVPREGLVGIHQQTRKEGPSLERRWPV